MSDKIKEIGDALVGLTVDEARELRAYLTRDEPPEAGGCVGVCVVPPTPTGGRAVVRPTYQELVESGVPGDPMFPGVMSRVVISDSIQTYRVRARKHLADAVAIGVDDPDIPTLAGEVCERGMIVPDDVGEWFWGVVLGERDLSTSDPPLIHNGGGR